MLMAGASRPRWGKNFILGNRGSGISLTAARDAHYNFETAMSSLCPVSLSDIECLRERWSGLLVRMVGILTTASPPARSTTKTPPSATSVPRHRQPPLDKLDAWDVFIAPALRPGHQHGLYTHQ